MGSANVKVWRRVLDGSSKRIRFRVWGGGGGEVRGARRGGRICFNGL